MLLVGVEPNLTAVIAEFEAKAESPISVMLSGSSILTFLFLNFLLKADLPILVAAKSAGNLIEVPVTVTAFTFARPAGLNPVMVSPLTVKSEAVKAKQQVLQVMNPLKSRMGLIVKVSWLQQVQLQVRRLYA